MSLFDDMNSRLVIFLFMDHVEIKVFFKSAVLEEVNDACSCQVMICDDAQLLSCDDVFRGVVDEESLFRFHFITVEYECEEVGVRFAEMNVEGEERLVEEAVELAVAEAQLQVAYEEVVVYLVAVAHEIDVVMTLEFFYQIDATLRYIEYHRIPYFIEFLV